MKLVRYRGDRNFYFTFWAISSIHRMHAAYMYIYVSMYMYACVYKCVIINADLRCFYFIANLFHC